MEYIIITMDKKEIIINGDEHIVLQNAPVDSMVYFRSCGVTVNKKSIASIHPYSRGEAIEKHVNQKDGVLHDGIRVTKRFGEWVVANTGEENPPRIDGHYYPEVARDCVPTVADYYTKYEQLPREKRLDAIMGTDPRPWRQITGGGFEGIKNILENRKQD